MTSATGAVQIDQSVIDGWTATVSGVSADISSATSTLANYIQTLLANQATPLPDADVANINAALSSLQSADTALKGIEPAPAPPSTPVPVVTAVADTTSGGALADAGGDSVEITGSGFSGATAVNFGTTPATSFTLNSDTSITAVAPAGTSGTTVDITVVTPAGTSATSAADQLSYA
jgi:large repetitive protein